MVAEREKEKKSADASSSQGQVLVEEQKIQPPQREQPSPEEPEVGTPPVNVSAQDSPGAAGAVNVSSVPSAGTDVKKDERYAMERLEPEKDENGRLKVRVGDLADGEAPLRVQVQNAALSDNLQELQKLTNWTPSQLQYFLEATGKGTPLVDVVRGMYPEPRLTPEQEKKKRRRENWQQAIAILGDLGIMAGDFIAAKGGGLVPKRTTTLSGEEGKRLEKLRQEHEAKMDKYRDLMIKAGMADAQTSAEKRMKAFEILTQATAEKRRQEQQQAVFDFQKQNAEQQNEREERKIDISQSQWEQQQKSDQEKLKLQLQQLALMKYRIDKDDYWKTLSAATRGEIKKQPFFINGKTYNVPRPYIDQFYDYLVQEVRKSDVLKGSTDPEDLKLLDSYQTLSAGEKKNLAISLMKRYPERIEKLTLFSPFVMENFLAGDTSQENNRQETPQGYNYFMNMAFGGEKDGRAVPTTPPVTDSGKNPESEESVSGSDNSQQEETYPLAFTNPNASASGQARGQSTQEKPASGDETPADPFEAIVYRSQQKKAEKEAGERQEQWKKEVRQAERVEEIAGEAKRLHEQIRDLNARKKPVIDTEEFIRSRGLDLYGPEARNVRALNAEHKRHNAEIDRQITSISQKLIYMDPQNRYR